MGNHEVVTEAVIETTEVIDLMVDDQEEIDHIMIDCQSEAEFMNQLMTGDNKNLEEFINKEGTAMITKFNITEEDALIEEIDKEIGNRGDRGDRGPGGRRPDRGGRREGRGGRRED